MRRGNTRVTAAASVTAATLTSGVASSKVLHPSRFRSTGANPSSGGQDNAMSAQSQKQRVSRAVRRSSTLPPPPPPLKSSPVAAAFASLGVAAEEERTALMRDVIRRGSRGGVVRASQHQANSSRANECDHNQGSSIYDNNGTSPVTASEATTSKNCGRHQIRRNALRHRPEEAILTSSREEGHPLKGAQGSDEGAATASSSFFSSSKRRTPEKASSTTSSPRHSLSSAYFHAYLRDRSSPFTMPSSSSPTTDASEHHMPSEASSALPPSQRPILGSGMEEAILGEWDLRPLPQTGQRRDSARASESADVSSRNEASRQAKNNRPSTNQSNTSSDGAPARSASSRSTQGSARALPHDSFHEDRVVVSQLRNRVAQRMRAANAQQLQKAFLQQYKIVKEVEFELTKLIASLQGDRNSDNRSPPAAHDALGDENEMENERDAPHGKSREDVLFSLDAQLFERIGQLQRSLQMLSPNHYAAVAALPVLPAPLPAAGRNGTHVNKSSPHRIRGQSLLLRFVQRTAVILALLQQLPHASGFFVKPEQAEGYARQSGARRAAQQAIASLITSPASTFLSPPQKQKASGQRKEEGAVPPSAELLEKDQLRRVWELLEAVLSLPFEDSPEIGFPASASNEQGTALLTMKAEEWCVRYFLKILSHHRGDAAQGTPRGLDGNQNYPMHGMPSVNGGHLLSLSQRIRTLRACMAAQDEVMRIHATLSPAQSSSLHSTNAASTATTPPRANVSFFVSPAKVAASATSGLHASGGKHALRVPFGIGKEFLLLTLRDVMSALEHCDKPATQGHDEDADHEPERHERNASVLSAHLSTFMRARSVATLCSALLFFDVHGKDALEFLAAAAPLCAEEAELLSGRDIANLLLCYATLGFGGTLPAPSTSAASVTGAAAAAAQTDPTDASIGANFYVILGTRAGELGDALRTEDVVTVLRAFDLVGDRLDAKVLRAALESSLRMRRLHKRTQYDAL